MLEHLRRRVCAALAAEQEGLLATCGQADLQVSRLPCEGQDLKLYLLVPRASDHLFNLEHEPQVVVVTPAWELRGRARLVRAAEQPPELRLSRRGEAQWSALVEVSAERLHLYGSGQRTAETIDVN
jgi:hypothetical protein